jgi:phage terminase large subunit-like protein
VARCGRVQHYQTPPDGDWIGWVMMGGRGTGKSHAGSVWINTVLGERSKPVQGRIIAPTQGDAINSAVHGVQQNAPHVTWRPTAPGGARLMWPNGSVAHVIGTPGPREVDRLRATTNITYDWLEEAAANPQLYAVVEQQTFSLRGEGFRWIATTTPRPLKIIRDWQDNPRISVTRATSFDNPYNPPEWLEMLRSSIPEGSRMWRQEVLGELITDYEGALWTQDGIDATRLDESPELVKVAVGVDPATGPGTTGIVVVGTTKDKHLVVVADASQAGTPNEWGRAVAALATEWEAPVIAEANQGGEMVTAVLDAAGVTTPVHLVRASESKRARAEPVSLMWEAGRAHIVGHFPLLEDELMAWVPGDAPSPDRLDAMVWAASWLRSKTYPTASLWKPRRRVPVG